jgi:D-amino-acid oxidase
MRAVVIGCGVSGLSTAIRLSEAGHEVEIWARDLPPHTTSNIAAAVWYPYKAFPKERVLGWGERTLNILYELGGEAESGVTIGESIELFRAQVEEPWWRGSVRRFRFARPDELPEGFSCGYVYETATIEMGVYLPYLMRRFAELGGKIVQREIHDMIDALREAPLAVNCAGLGTLGFLPDKELFPIRGQVIRAAKLPIERSMLDDEEDDMGCLAYIVPRSNDCILGGTAQVGNWSLEPDGATAERILERCARLAPQVRDAQILEHRVGLRPGRSSVVVEVIGLPGGGTVGHNYGHGGAGVTLSWGCAEEIVREVREQTGS